MLDLIAIGDIKLDTFVFLEDARTECELRDKNCWLCLRYGAKLTLKRYETQIAGSAPNVAIGLSRLGITTGVVSIVGHDPTAHLAHEALRQEGVATSGIKELKEAKSSFSIVLLYRGERTMLTSHSPHHYRLARCPKTRWLYVSELGEDYKELYTDVVRHVRAKKIKLGFNPGTIQIRAGAKKLKSILKNTEALFVNKEEAHELLKERNHFDMGRLIRTLWKLGPNIVVVTDGKNGAFAFDGGEIFSVPAFPAHKVETTGAGDSFSTGFLAALMQKKGLDEALRWGSVNSASVISAVGPQPGLLKKSELVRRLKKNPTFKATTL